MAVWWYLLVPLVGVLLGVVLALAVGLREAEGQAVRSLGWGVPCGFVRSAPIDPIIHPGTYGISHQHDFFGNTQVTKNSTYEQLRAGYTKCRFVDGSSSGDKSAYWIPEVRREDGTRVQVKQAFAYYRTGDLPPGEIEPYPAGLKVVAGDPHAAGGQPWPWPEPDKAPIVYWRCGGTGDDGNRWDLPHDCTDPNYPNVVSVVKFPNCAKYGLTDSEDHRSHMAYPLNDTCPATHPMEVPQLRVVVRYDTSQGEGLRLAHNSENAYGMHADFFDAWNPVRLRELIDRCIKSGTGCRLNGKP